MGHKGSVIGVLLIKRLSNCTAGRENSREYEKICEDITLGKLVECSLSMRIFKYEALLSISKDKWLPYIFNEIRSSIFKEAAPL